jgi:peroxiredoxin
MNRFSFALALLAMIGLGVSSFSAFAREDDHGHAHAKVGHAAPEFALTDQNGNVVSLSNYKGKIVVLEWFNDECPFVKKFYDKGNYVMNDWAKAYGDKGVVWLAINSTASHDMAHNKKVAEKWKIDRPILDDSSGEVGEQYNAKTTPHMYVINADGVLAYAGAIDDNGSPDSAEIKNAKNYVAQAVDELLAGKKVSKSESKSYGCSVKYKK